MLSLMGQEVWGEVGWQTFQTAQTERETERETERGRERERETERERHRDTERDTERETERERKRDTRYGHTPVPKLTLLASSLVTVALAARLKGPQQKQEAFLHVLQKPI